MYNIVIKKNDRFYFMLLAMCMLLGMLSPNMSAQGMSNADITGKVVDQYGNPVSDVTVTMKNSNFKAVTGVDGIFKFQLKKGDILCSVADAVLKNGGEVTGVIPRFMVEQNWHHTGLTELIEVESMHERKRKMADLSDGIIALPGGCGTLEELLEIITWKQLGLYLNPIVILNINGFFDPLLEMLEKAIDENFMRRQHGDIWKVAQTPEEAVQLLYEIPVWDISIRKFAAI